ncbi:MAG: ATP-binding cassette domain-containing protein [Ilumatobacteraceae bacterium]
MSNRVIEAEGVSKRFDEVDAVDQVSFAVGAGEVLGLLGPNGAGKTTLVKLLTTLLSIDSGTARVGGFDVSSEPGVVRRLIGLAGQAAAVDEKLTARENLELFGRLYHLPRGRRRARIGELIDRFDLRSFADRPASTYSGGQRRRLDIVVALIADPPALFLDEPTTGLDPRSRAEVWKSVRELAAEGTAIVLTTQYLEEADQLADHILVIDRGRSVAAGTPDQLKSQIGGDVLEIRVVDPGPVEALVAEIEGVAVDWDRRTVDIPITAGSEQSLDLLGALQAAGTTIEDFQLRRPTLDEVFLALTGDASTPGAEAAR